jgi:hypothetical protein
MPKHVGVQYLTLLYSMHFCCCINWQSQNLASVAAAGVSLCTDPRDLRPVQISLLLLYMLYWLLSTRSLHLGSHTTVFDIIQGVSFIVPMSTAAVIRCPCRWGLRVRYTCMLSDTTKTRPSTCGFAGYVLRKDRVGSTFWYCWLLLNTETLYICGIDREFVLVCLFLEELWALISHLMSNINLHFT